MDVLIGDAQVPDPIGGLNALHVWRLDLDNKLQTGRIPNQNQSSNHQRGEIRKTHATLPLGAG